MGNAQCCGDAEPKPDKENPEQKPQAEEGEKRPMEVGESPAIVGEPDEPPELASSQTMEQIERRVNMDVAGDEDETGMTKCVFDARRKLKFAAYVTQLDNKKLENFLLRFEFASEAMDKNKVELLFHALICLYLRKVEKKEHLPKDDATKKFCEELSKELFEKYDNKPSIRAKAMTRWIQREDLLNLYKDK